MCQQNVLRFFVSTTHVYHVALTFFLPFCCQPVTKCSIHRMDISNLRKPGKKFIGIFGGIRNAKSECYFHHFHPTDFREILCLRFFKFVDTLRFLLKLDKCMRHCKRKLKCIYYLSLLFFFVRDTYSCIRTHENNVLREVSSKAN